jgi:hypothetical protein
MKILDLKKEALDDQSVVDGSQGRVKMTSRYCIESGAMN